MCASDLSNVTFYCLTGGQCVNASLVCDGIDHCADGSDESFTHAHCYDIYKTSSGHRLPIIELMAVIIGCVILFAVVCCLFSAAIDCILHIYRYWCPNNESKTNTQHDQDMHQHLSTPPQTRHDTHNSSVEPILLVLKELPTNCSTVVLTCQPDMSGRDSDACNSRRTVIRYVTMSGGRYHASGRRGMSLIGSSRSSSTCFRPLVVRPSDHCDLCRNVSEYPEEQLMLTSCRRDSLILYCSSETENSDARSQTATCGEFFRMKAPSAPPPSYSSVCVGSCSTNKSYRKQPPADPELSME